MSNHPADLRYTESHEWIRDEGDNTFTVGITDHAQGMLGDIVFVELPEIDVDVSANDEVAVIESVKTAADVYSPLSGHIMAINEELTATPDAVNRDPYGDGWLFRIKITDEKQLEDLMDANDYEQSINE
ncbi:MAG: glycine cleavage system protein GcvH [Coxiellaceae bacterium]|nr:glycine cleavage system protein GcvH [Coxiellaceae bacterium]